MGRTIHGLIPPVHSRIAGLLVAAALEACAAANVQEFALAAGDLWIRDATVISPERDQPLRNAHVVVRAGRIVWVGGRPRTSDRVTVLDATGRYLIPGLIDGHVHLTSVPPGMSRAQADAKPDLVVSFTEQLPRSYLYFGFTTLVDLGVKDETVLHRIRTAPVAPQVLDCGPPLVVVNGYPMNLHPASERFSRYPNFLYDSRQADSIPWEVRVTEHTAEVAVNRVRAGGGKCVKAFVEFGNPKRPWPVPSDTMLREARDAAHRAGLPLLLHANSLDAHRIAGRIVPDAVAHGLWSWPKLAEPGGRTDTLPTSVRKVLDEERAAGIAYMPTLRVIDGLLDLADTMFLNRPALARILPPGLLTWYRGADAHAVAIDENPGGPMLELLRSASALGRRALAYTARSGGRIVFGSDTPSGSVYANPPGYNGYLELRAMEAAGLTPRQVLAAATVENARLFGMAQQSGTIEVGKIADLLLLDLDPLESTAAFDAIGTVIVGGRVIPREELTARAPTR